MKPSTLETTEKQETQAQEECTLKSNDMVGPDDDLPREEKNSQSVILDSAEDKKKTPKLERIGIDNDDKLAENTKERNKRKYGQETFTEQIAQSKKMKANEDITQSKSEADSINENDTDEVEDQIEVDNLEKIEDTSMQRKRLAEDLNGKCNLKTKRPLLPGQPENWENPSTNLTASSFTGVPKQRISSQKFPCFIPKLQAKCHKKVFFAFHLS